MQTIANLKERDRVQEVYLVKNVVHARQKSGSEYISVVLADKTGTVDGKIWDPDSPGIEDVEPYDYAHVVGEVTVFQGQNQIKITRIYRAVEGEYVPEDYLPVSPYDIEEMYTRLLALSHSVKQTHLRQLLDVFFENAAFKKMFSQASAAKSLHHAFVGGLLQHTLAVTELCDILAQRYPVLNRDLLITAALFHDVGKVKELSRFPMNDYTDDGQLLGHIAMGYEMISSGIRGIEGFPPALASELKHCILAHHGELTYGSPKTPALAEAVALHMADNMDAKMQHMTEAFETIEPTDQSWQKKDFMLDGSFRRTGHYE